MITIVIPNEIRAKFNRVWWMLKLTYGLFLIAAGADKFVNFLTYWPKYVSATVLAVIPLPVESLLYIFAIIEIIIGLLILSKFTRIGAYLAVVSMGIVVLNLLSMFTVFDIVTRDVVMIIGALALAWLTEIKEEFHIAK